MGARAAHAPTHGVAAGLPPRSGSPPFPSQSPAARGLSDLYGPSLGSPSCRAVRLSAEETQQPPLETAAQAEAAPTRNRGSEHTGGEAYLGIGWDVGTTGTNLGQLAICSWTFMQEETCTLILASVT